MSEVTESMLKSISELGHKYHLETSVSRYNKRYLEALLVAEALLKSHTQDELFGSPKHNVVNTIDKCLGMYPEICKTINLGEIGRRLDKMPLIRCELCRCLFNDICTSEQKKMDPTGTHFCLGYYSIFNDKDLDLKKYTHDITKLEEALKTKKMPGFVRNTVQEVLKIYEDFFASQYTEQGFNYADNFLDKVIAEKKKELFK